MSRLRGSLCFLGLLVSPVALAAAPDAPPVALAAAPDAPPVALAAAPDAPPVAVESGPVRLQFEGYVQRVLESNLDLIAQRANVPIAQAQVAVAKAFPNPLVTTGVSQYDISGQGNPTTALAQLNVPLELGGKRRARVQAAEAGVSVSEAELKDAIRNLRADAANAFVDALHARSNLERKRQTLKSLERLVSVNIERLRAGDIGEVELVQSRVEAQQFRADVLAAEGAVKAADLALLQLLGQRGPLPSSGIDLEGDLKVFELHLSPDKLVERALNERADLHAAERRATVASRQVSLARANRVIDVDLGLSYSHYFSVPGPATTPNADLLGLTMSLPLPFANYYRGELDAAMATQRQSEVQVKAVTVKVETEVRQAIARYEASQQRAAIYTSGTLKDADLVLEKTLYNYQRGGATLVEVLVAQRTVDDVYISYYDAQADAARALIAVQQATGTWDLQL